MNGAGGCTVCERPRDDGLCVVLDTVCFCEECYRTGYFAGLSCEEVVELHFRFGCSYEAAGRDVEAIDALHAGMRLHPRPEMLLTAARCYERLGNEVLAAALRSQQGLLK